MIHDCFSFVTNFTYCIVLVDAGLKTNVHSIIMDND